MIWSYKEDEIVCKFYLKHVDSYNLYMKDLMQELFNNGFVQRDLNSTRMRLNNYKFLHTGTGLSNASKQSVKVYNSLINGEE